MLQPDGAAGPHRAHARGRQHRRLHAAARRPPSQRRLTRRRHNGRDGGATQAGASGHARLVQPGHRRRWSAPSPRRAGAGAGRSSTRWPRCSRSGRSSRSTTARATCAARPRSSSTRSTSCRCSSSREQGKPRSEAYTMELLPTIDGLHWIADNGPKILGDEQDPLPADLLEDEEVVGRVRAARRRRRDRAVELPVVDPVRRGRDRAHVRQRRGAEARLADPADRRADPARVRARRRARGPRARRARRRRGRQRAGRVERRQGLLHGIGRGRPRGRRRRGGAAQGLRARARRQGPDDRARGREPAQRDRGLRVGRLRERGPDVLGHRARLRDARRRRRASSAASSRRRKRLRLGDPASADTEVGPMVSKEQYDLVLRAGRRRRRPPARSCHCGGPVDGRRPARRDLLRARRPDRRHPATCGSCARRSSARSSRSSPSTPRRRRSGWRTTRRSGSAPRSGPTTATKGGGSPAGSSREWSGSTTTCTRTARCRRRGAGRRSRASAARTARTASTSA